MCECEREQPRLNMPQQLGAVYDAVDPSVMRTSAVPAPVEPSQHPSQITFEDLYSIYGLYRIAKFLSEI